MADYISGLELSVQNQTHIKTHAVTQITIAESSSDCKPGTFSAGELGSTKSHQICQTCGCKMDRTSKHECPGHFGFIELVKPVYLFQYLGICIDILQAVCLKCSKILTRPSNPKWMAKFNATIKLTSSRTRLRDIIALQKTINECPCCNSERCKVYRADKPKVGIVVEHNAYTDTVSKIKVSNRKTLEEERALKILSSISREDLVILGFEPDKFNPADFIARYVPVPPMHVRPTIQTMDGKSQIDDITLSLVEVLRKTQKQQSKANTNANTEQSIHELVGFHVATIYNNKTNLLYKSQTRTGKPLISITERLNTKKGLVRQNIMGKRVDYCARSVITPNANCNISEVVIPLQMAMELTYPEIVTRNNIDRLRVLMENRAVRYPGVNLVKLKRNGEMKDLKYVQGVIDLSLGDIVHRHIQTGDMLLLNRQPTLHKIGMMGMRAKVRKPRLDEQGDNRSHTDKGILTISFKPPVCKPFNADYDGDEMNIHAPQSSGASLELELIAALPVQIISVATCSPTISMYFDSLLGIWFLTEENRMLSPVQASNLLSNIPLNVSEQFESGAFAGTNVNGRAICSSILPRELSMSKKGTLIECGELKEGAINKSIAGAYEAGNIFHRIWDLKDPYTCCAAINNMTMIANQYLLQRGFTISLRDIIFPDETRDEVKAIAHETCDTVNRLFQMVEDGTEDYSVAENMAIQHLQVLRDDCTKVIMKLMTYKNNLYAMSGGGAGSKGKSLNIGQLTACLGLQQYDTERPQDRGLIPRDYNGRSFPYYCKGDNSPESRGVVINSFYEGLNPCEFFAHAMVGRVGLIDTAVKTAKTGYLNRKLVKSCESIMLCYDGTVRVANGDIVQYMYGDNNANPQCIYQNPLELPFQSLTEVRAMHVFTKAELRKFPGKFDNAAYEKRINTYKTGLSKWLCQCWYTNFNVPRSVHLTVNFLSLIQMVRKCQIPNTVLIKVKSEVRSWRKKNKGERLKLCHVRGMLDKLNFQKYRTQASRIMWDLKHPTDKDNSLNPEYVLTNLEALMNDPVVSQLFPSEQDVKEKSIRFERNKVSMWLFERVLHSFLSPKRCILEYKFDKSQFNDMIRLIRRKLICGTLDPGTMVGVWAAQSIGEPLTQQTLNTFHTAGAGDGVGSMGIPRIKEIMNVSKNLKQPIMKVYLKPEYEGNKSIAELVASHIKEIYLKDVYKDVDIRNDPSHAYTKLDGMYNSFRLFQYLDRMVESKHIGTLNFVLRIRLDKTKLFKNNLSMWTIRLAFIKFWKVYLPSMTRGKKHIKTISNIITGCTLLTNSETDDVPMMHIRLGLTKFDVETLSDICDVFLNHFRIRGFKGIKSTHVRKFANRFVDKDGVLQEVNSDNEKCYMINCVGINITEIGTIRYVDMNRTVTNDMWVEYTTSGIEAVRTILLKELRVITGFDEVLYHHLTILIDYMCHTGTMIPITRHGVNRLDRDFIARASFEQTTNVLLQAAIWSHPDRMQTVSSNIAAGNKCRIGTGYSDIRVNFSALDDLPHMDEQEVDVLDIFRNKITEDIMSKPPPSVYVPQM